MTFSISPLQRSLVPSGSQVPQDTEKSRPAFTRGRDQTTASHGTPPGAERTAPDGTTGHSKHRTDARNVDGLGFRRIGNQIRGFANDVRTTLNPSRALVYPHPSRSVFYVSNEPQQPIGTTYQIPEIYGPDHFFTRL